MSRIGKNPIEIPANTDVSVSDGVITVKGPKGELTRPTHPAVSIEVADGTATVAPTNNGQLARALWGTYASHIRNMIAGVTEEFEKKLVIEGVGYRGEVSGNTVVLTVGYSHAVELPIPEGVSVDIQKNEITIRGADKDVVGQFAANIRATRKPEPYKGKGIRYGDEVVRRKQGKRAVT